MAQTVLRSSLEYVTGEVTELEDKDITAVTFQVLITAASVTSPPTSGWLAADRIARPRKSRAKISALVGIAGTWNLVPGNYKMWIRISDSPENVIPNDPVEITVV